jgi:hypothetical protein
MGGQRSERDETGRGHQRHCQQAGLVGQQPHSPAAMPVVCMWREHYVCLSHHPGQSVPTGNLRTC